MSTAAASNTSAAAGTKPKGAKTEFPAALKEVGAKGCFVRSREADMDGVNTRYITTDEWLSSWSKYMDKGKMVSLPARRSARSV